MTQLFQELKQATCSAHRKLDHHPLLARLMHRDLTLTDYRETLTQMWVAHSELEDQVIGFWRVHSHTYQPERRKHLLQQELKQLGVSIQQLRTSTGSDELQVAPLYSLSEAVGATYVLEGSRLGGMVLARAVEKRLVGHHCLFFSSGGAGHWENFQRFCADAIEHIERSTAIATAVKSFERYYSVINAKEIA
ncbi:biliverdin-producing heme oxygenase [Pseudidiomarina homiensis]|uniref:biliverdin-producing heme oxygenase n=1 Tax=Pseudidiomarina homiensis TaxID=364198 RepID=UPI00215B2430|nr:biliverdin-producing heme oxygenase [Pseudidiomarina homiensis]